jgi:hypothetical protein
MLENDLHSGTIQENGALSRNAFPHDLAAQGLGIP